MEEGTADRARSGRRRLRALARPERGKARGGLRRDVEALGREGYDARVCFVDHGETAASTAGEALAEADWDCVLIGAGVRSDENEFALFETLVNVVHRQAPGASICFNTGPTDSVAAVRRWAWKALRDRRLGPAGRGRRRRG